MNSNQIFELYHTQSSFSQDDIADFYVYVQDTSHPQDGMMAIAGLSINIIENAWDQDKLMLLLTCCDGISPECFERVLVGLLLALMVHDQYIRRDKELLGEIQEVLTYAPELSFTALSNIARTTQMKHMEQFNAQLAQELLPLMHNRASNEFYDIINSRQSEMEHIAKMHLDQNFLIFREFYSNAFFREKAAHWLLPWTEDALMNIMEEDRYEVNKLIQTWPMCDSDKYALCHMYKSFKGVIQNQLSVDSLLDVGMDIAGKEIITNGYVQQLYRYFRLSSFAKGKPFDLAKKLRDLLVYRLIVVGSRAQQAINELLV